VNILFVSSEVAPLIKTGGLADVSGALPAALRRLGHDCRILMPGYRGLMDRLQVERRRPAATLLTHRGRTHVLQGVMAGSDVPVYFIDAPALFDRDGGPYADALGRDWPDNAQRFALLGDVAAVLAGPRSPLDWPLDILHLNDWQAGLAAAYLRQQSNVSTRVLFTIHNLAFQGNFDKLVLPELGLPWELFTSQGLEFYDQLSFMKAGLVWSDHITTVSPSYAAEIQAAEMGCGLDGLLRQRTADLSGILNGVDVNFWNPATDPYIQFRYDAGSLHLKVLNKIALQHELGLEADDNIPLLGVVSRLTHQKGLDLLADILPGLMADGVQCALLGGGDSALEARFKALASAHPRQCALGAGYNEPLAHRIEAGADIFVMPSRFEPCGLNQMYSMRYGTPPVVRRTGGLADTVTPVTVHSLLERTATGFLFGPPTAEALLGELQRALARWRQPKVWRQIQENGMAQDFSWDVSAAAYAALYQRLQGVPDA
jgi:starch synthase